MTRITRTAHQRSFIAPFASFASFAASPLHSSPRFYSKSGCLSARTAPIIRHNRNHKVRARRDTSRLSSSRRERVRPIFRFRNLQQLTLIFPLKEKSHERADRALCPAVVCRAAACCRQGAEFGGGCDSRSRKRYVGGGHTRRHRGSSESSSHRQGPFRRQ